MKGKKPRKPFIKLFYILIKILGFEFVVHIKRDGGKKKKLK